ncbi:hypothetical protein BGZ47_009084 [Haplosporangium gracile]|nr:hypothetical protein BGZ47_009084 [Haplosporangium gracile]
MTTTATTISNSNTLGDFDVLLSFLHLERTSLATPSTAAPPSPTTTATASAAASPVGDPSSMVAPTWGNSHNTHTSAHPSTSAATATSQLGDLSMVLRYLEAHKTCSSASTNSFSKHLTLDPAFSSFFLSTPTVLPLAQTIQNLDLTPAEADEDEDENEDSSASSRRRLKKKATRKLPIDEPSSSSGGGWVSSESDHKEEVMGRSSEEPDIVALEDASNTQPPDTIATLTDFLAKELQQQYQQQQQEQQEQKLGQPMVNRTQQLNIHSLSTLTVAKPNHITLPPPPTIATTNNKIAASATTAVVSASASGTGAVFIKKKRPWRTAKVLREMKAMFMEEQKRKTLQQQQQSLDNNCPANVSTKPNIAATTTTTMTPVTLVTPPKTMQKKVERELVLDQTPGCEPEFQWRPRSHYNNFWKSCTITRTTAGTTTDTNRSSSSSSSSSEEESPLRFRRGCIIIPASSSSAFAFGSKTSARPTSCASETTSKIAESKRLLALRVRDTFLVPRGTNLLDQALSHAEAHLPDPVVPSPPQPEGKPKLTSTTRLELGTMKSLTRITTPLSGPPQLADKLRPAPATSTWTSTEQPKPDSTPSPPKSASAAPSNERVFIFVDNSNILHGFYQSRQQLEAQRAADGIPADGISSSTVRSRPEDGEDHHHHQDQVSLHKSPSHCSETLVFEDGMALVTPTTTTNDDGLKSFPPGTGSNGTSGNSNNGNGTGTKAKMARGSHRLPKFNYSKFFDLLKRDRTAARQVLVGSSPLFQELDDAMEHRYETIILRRVKKFVQGELGAIPVPVKQLRFPSSNFSNSGAVVGPWSFCDGAEPSVDKSTNTVTPLTAAPSTATAAGSGSGSSGGGSQGEQGVDELLHLKMLETLLDHEPATIVLASGDGGDSEFGGGGFYAVIKRALNRGWHVEIISWEDQLSGVYLELALEYGYSCEHKLTTTATATATATGESADNKRCHALSSFSLETVVGGQKKQKKQQKYRPTGTKKQRALALALAQKEKEKEEKEKEGKQRGCGHLRVWCLDWYGDILLQPTPIRTE